jgi:hypothetical protein
MYLKVSWLYPFLGVVVIANVVNSEYFVVFLSHGSCFPIWWSIVFCLSVGGVDSCMKFDVVTSLHFVLLFLAKLLSVSTTISKWFCHVPCKWCISCLNVFNNLRLFRIFVLNSDCPCLVFCKFFSWVEHQDVRSELEKMTLKIFATNF